MRPRKPAATVQDVSTSDPLAAIAALLQKQDAVLERLVGAVESLASSTRDATVPGGPADDEPAPTGPPAAVESPLVECTDAAIHFARVGQGRAAKLPAHATDEFARFGGRGLYRAHRELVMERSMDFRRAVVEDAQREDPEEARRMGADLMKYMGEHDEPEF